MIQFFILEELRFLGLKILRNLHVTESRFHQKSFYMRILDVFNFFFLLFHHALKRLYNLGVKLFASCTVFICFSSCFMIVYSSNL